jgi:hypothetical protein
MKKAKYILITLFLILFLSFSATVNAETIKPISGTGSVKVATGTGNFYGISIRTDGVNPVTVDVYDGLGVSVYNVKLIPATTVIPGNFTFGWVIPYWPGLPFTKGVYVNVTVANGGTCAWLAEIGQ